MYDTLQAERVSDFHLHAGKPLTCRVHGELKTYEDKMITEDDLQDLITSEVPEDWYQKFREHKDLDFAFVIKDTRFRASALGTITGTGLVLRVIVSEVPNIDMLGLPPAVHQALELRDGLVLVTGATGSGKSTSLAAMIDKINRTRAENIITVEDPIEFTHQNQKSLIVQREVGKDTDTFASALKGALRQDPDVILMGELRDYETISMALTAAETGHLVFGTLHTNGAPETINRLVDAFPPEEQSKAQAQLSLSLRLVMTQQLMKKKGGGRIGAFEVMVNTPAVANLIREKKISQIANMMQTGAKEGMMLMEKYKEILLGKGLIESID
ncbi:twitching motility protein PilT [Methylophilales bacterium MBRSG12]|uniref:Twitching motility protein PilT n=1 Tax=Methylophilales bacterium MBRS-H7 TaxID=1623450 RepID=A0A0H4IZS4_9PROT|nr:twitching motility protein PilT [Methylophilales bacterium MBRSF5]AKO66476.1 twitching motility protein PilT [Methylophilales bacterium MBRS-H7]AKO67790.1 twitching motility protein PilT [Methylophilales bacterium MBRSG12]